MKAFYIYNFGCKVNQEEGAAIAALFISKGWQQVFEEKADLFIINTCTVTAMADKKARNLIRRLRKENPDSILAVCGCYAQRAAEEVQALGVDIVAGVDERRLLPELVAKLQQEDSVQQVGDILATTEFHRISEGSVQVRARAYLKIEDGCDQFCNYCIIPYVRGPVRSLPFADAVAEAEQLVADGHREIVLTGIHIGAYGRDLPEGESLPRLIHRLCEIPGLVRLRLGSVEPRQFTEELIEALHEEKVCPHLHIPLQAGADKTLLAMKRNYDTEFYRSLVKRLRAELGDFALATDVMVGYPGETPEDFALSRAFCEEMGYAAMHIFPYSRREGTPAAKAPDQVKQAEKAERASLLNDSAVRMEQAYLSSRMGTELRLMVEEGETIDGVSYVKGHSDEYLMLYLPSEGIPSGTVMTVRGESLFRDGLLVSAI